MKSAGRKITMLTAYDYAMAGLVDAAGIEGILVGDSLRWSSKAIAPPYRSRWRR